VTSPNVFAYNSDCKQPDPEIWGGGAAGGPLLISSGLDFSQKLSKKYVGDLPTFNFSIETALEKTSKKYIGNYPTYTLSTSFAAEFLVYNVPENTIVFSIQGESVDYFISSEDLGTPNLEYSGFITEKVTYDYSNPSSNVEFLSEDDGLITSTITSLVDYGLITSPLEEHLDYGSTEILGNTEAATGLIQVSGSSNYSAFIKEINTILLQTSGTCKEEVCFNPPIDENIFKNDISSSILTFDNNQLTFDISEPKPNIKLTGSSVNIFISNTPEGIFNIETDGICIENVTYNYSLPTNLPFISETSGLIVEGVTSQFDYGLITSEVSQGNEDLGLIINSAPVTPFGSIANITGSAFVKPPDDIRTYNASGEYKVTYSPDNTTGSLFNFGEKVESVTYDYNLSSADILTTFDEGSISTSPTEFVDYGFVYETSLSGIEDYNTIQITSSNLPFGSVSINGSATTEWINKNFSARGEYKVTYSPDDTTGSLFNFGEKVESVTYDYNESSSLILETLDIGLITDLITVSVDYGFITDIPVGQEDDGLITSSSTIIPFGGFTINGSATTEWINKNFSGNGQYKIVYNTSTFGSLFGFGEKLESVSYDYNETSVLIVGDPDYGQISIGSTTLDDYGFVAEPHVQTDDLGFVIGFPAISDVFPYGTITIFGSAIEFGLFEIPEETVVISIGGIGEESITYVPSINRKRYDKSFDSETLSLDSTVETFDDTTEQPNIKLTGSYDAPAVYSEVGSGSLFNLGIADESATYDYNNESVVILTTTDSGLITDPVTNTIDYGFITDPVIGQDDDGLISDIQTVVPFGRLTVNGSADTLWVNVNIYNSPESAVRVTYSPDDLSGTLFGFGEKLESITHRYTEQSVFIVGDPDYGVIAVGYTRTDDYGLITEAHSQRDDLGWLVGFPAIDDVYPFGSITILGSAFESNISSEVLTGLFVISGSADLYYTPEFAGTGSINISGSADVAFSPDFVASETLTLSGTFIERATKSYSESFGTITISGTPLIHPEVDYTPAYTGTGTLSIFGDATYSETDAFGVGRRRGGTINLCGDATYSETDAYVGLGTISLDREGITVPAVLARTRSYVGIETIILSDSGLESRTVFIPTSGIGTGFIGGSITILGGATESYSAQTPEDIQLFTFSGELNHPNIDYTPHYGIEKNIGIGTTGIQITELSSAIEKFSANTPENTQLFQILGSGIEKVKFDTPENTQLFTISGVALESESESYVGVGGTLTLSDFGIEKNTESYVGVGTLYVSGVVDDSAQRIARGTGTINLVNGFSPQESYPWLPEPGVGRSWSFTRPTYIDQGSLTISSGIAQTHYYSPIYPRNSGDPGSGIGTIRINDDKGLTITRAVLPYFAKGEIFVSGIGAESFTPQTEIGSGLITLSGISSTREINVYQGYVTSGTITISQQTQSIIEKNTESYIGFGTIFISESIVERNTESYFGTGTLFTLAGSSEVYSAQTPEDTATLTISGSAEESFVAQTPEDTILYKFSGAATDERITKSYVGSGSATISGSATARSTSSHLATGTIRFAKYTSDQNYDTCDSVDITSDNLYSAKVSFVANPPEDTVLFVIDGDAGTSETALYTETSTGLYILSGTYQDIKLTYTESGIGTVFITSTSSESERDVYIGSGSLFTISGGTEYYSVQTPESTILLQISGSAVTSVEFEYSIAGIGLFSFNGSANTSEIASYTQIGSGNITLSGQLVYPDIVFIPSPDGSGIINILGSSDKSLTKIYETDGTLFNFSSGFESFTKSTYIGIGTVYIQEISGSTINNPFQIPRTYVCII